MNLKETIKEIKALLLGHDLKLETEKLADGKTVLEAEIFDVNQSVFIKTSTENVPLPVGEYQLENGKMLTVEVEGTIALISEKEAEEETQIENARQALERAFGKTKIEASEEVIEEPVAEEVAEVAAEAVEEPVEEAVEEAVAEEPVAEFVSRKEFDYAISTIANEFTSFKEKYQMSIQSITEKETEIETLKTELSKQPAAKKIVHTPAEEVVNENKGKKGKTPFESILNRIPNQK